MSESPKSRKIFLYIRGRKPYENEGVTILEMERPRVRFISDFFKDTEKF